jgi:hypothetical protein
MEIPLRLSVSLVVAFSWTLRQAGSPRYSRLGGLRYRLAVDSFEVGEKLSGAELVFVFGPGVLDVLGGDAGGEAAQTRGEVEKAGEIGDPETFFAVSPIMAESGAGERDALAMELPFLIAKASGAFEGEFLSGIGRSGPVLQR